MDTHGETQVIEAPRGWSIAGFVFTALPAALALGLSIFFYADGNRLFRALLMAAVGLGLLALAADFLLRAIRPSRLLITPHGLTLDTLYRCQSWPWPAVRGLHGWFNLVLRVADASGRVRRLTIGHWPPDMPRQLYISAGLSPLPEPRGKGEWGSFFFLAGLLVLLGALVAWVNLRG